MVTTAALRLEIDARQMKQGAAEAEKAIVSVGEGAKRTAREVKISTESIEKRLDAIVDGMLASNKTLAESNAQLQRIAQGVERSMVKAQETTQNFGREIHKTGGIVDAVERKFAGIGKAAVGMFAVDVVAKVVGFSSAMDVLQKATQGVADALQLVTGYTAQAERLEREREQLLKTADFWDGLKVSVEGYYAAINKNVIKYDFPETQARIFYPGKNETPWGAGRLNADDFTEEQRRSRPMFYKYDPPTMSLDTTGLSPTSVNLLNERILELQSVFAGLSDSVSLKYGQSNPGFAPRAADFERRQQEIYTLLESLRRDERNIANAPGILGQGYTSVGGMRVGSDEWFAQEAITARRSYRPDLGDFYSGGAGVSRRSRSAAEQISLNWQRGSALNTSELARLSGYGGIPDVPERSGDYFPIMGDAPAPFYERFPAPPDGRNRKDRWLYGENEGRFDGGYIGALQNRYSPERIAEQFSASFYQSLEASVMTGDFSNFGRSVMQMIGQSLMESLVAAPIQEAMASLMQALLGGMRNGFGGGAGAVSNGAYLPAGGGPGAPAPIQAGGTSTSVAPYRSPKQRYDDFGRRNLR